MYKKKTYKCKQNDSQIRVVFLNEKIDELHFKAKGDDGWMVIGFKDLKEALKMKPQTR